MLWKFVPYPLRINARSNSTTNRVYMVTDAIQIHLHLHLHTFIFFHLLYHRSSLELLTANHRAFVLINSNYVHLFHMARVLSATTRGKK